MIHDQFNTILNRPDITVMADWAKTSSYYLLNTITEREEKCSRCRVPVVASTVDTGVWMNESSAKSMMH